MNWRFWRRVGTFRNSGASTSVERVLTTHTLDDLEKCIAHVRTAAPEERAIALDGLAFVAGCVMDDASQEWERLVGRKWERYVD